MIKLNVTGRNMEISQKSRDYVEEQIGNLDKYLPRRMREAAKGTVVLELDANGREDNHFVCEVVINLPGQVVQSKEGTVNIFASIDVVEAKLKSQIRTYKDKHVTEPRRSHALGRLMTKVAEPELD